MYNMYRVHGFITKWMSTSTCPLELKIAIATWLSLLKAIFLKINFLAASKTFEFDLKNQ